MEPVAIFCIDDHDLVRRGFVDAMVKLPGVTIAGEAVSVDEALNCQAEPEIVFLDLELGGDTLMRERALIALKNRWPDSKTIILTASEAKEDLLSMLGAGAEGYLTKHVSLSQLQEAIDKVSAGEVYVTPRMAAYLLQEDNSSPRDDLSLSSREREVLKLLAEGDRDQDIAQRLFISVKTVQSHLTRIRDKTGQRRRAELTRLAMEKGLIKREIKN